MKINSPMFSLKTTRCECCSGQGALCFSTCSNCGHIALVCDEVGTIFFNPKNLEIAVYAGLEDPNCICPKCQKTHISDFKNSTGEEIQSLGFSIDDYE